jgi:hypothetical protein
MADGWWREEGRKESRDVLWWWWRGGLSAHASVLTNRVWIFLLSWKESGMAIGILFFPMARYWFLLDFLEKRNSTVLLARGTSDSSTFRFLKILKPNTSIF